MTDHPSRENYLELNERGLVVYERDDAELTALAACLTALRDLDANAAARVAHYVAERHLKMASPSIVGFRERNTGAIHAPDDIEIIRQGRTVPE